MAFDPVKKAAELSGQAPSNSNSNGSKKERKEAEVYADIGLIHEGEFVEVLRFGIGVDTQEPFANRDGNPHLALRNKLMADFQAIGHALGNEEEEFLTMTVRVRRRRAKVEPVEVQVSGPTLSDFKLTGVKTRSSRAEAA